MIRFVIEAISRDGNAALNIPMLPDGSIEDACVTMLEEVGNWMAINGEAVYGSHAWKKIGEGELTNKGKLKKLPGGGLGKATRTSSSTLKTYVSRWARTVHSMPSAWLCQMEENR